MNQQLQTLQKHVKTNKYIIWLRTQVFSAKTVTVRGHTVKLYPLRLAAVLLALALVLILLVELVILPYQAPRAVDAAAFESGSGYALLPYQGTMLLSDAGGTTALTRGGKVRWEVSDAKTNPLTDTDGDYYLRTEPGSGNKTSIYRGDRLIRTLESDHTVITAKVNRHGYAAIAAEETGYKGMVTVYDNDGQPLYTWHSGEGYITDVDLSKNGQYLVVAQLMSDAETAYTRILFIDIRRDETVASMQREGALVSSLTFLENDTLIAVSDIDVAAYTRTGEEQYSFSLTGKDPSLFAVSDQLLVFLCTDGRGNSVLEIYRAGNGAYSGSYTANDQIQCLAVNGNIIAAGMRKDVLYISPSGKCKRTVTLPHDVNALGLFSDKRTVLAVGGNQAHLLRIR